MDAVTTSQLTYVLSRLVDGTLDEAGRHAWEALAALARRIRHQGPGKDALDVPGAADNGKVDITLLAAGLARHAETDPGFARLLREWWTTADRLARGDDQGTVNVISGSVHGASIQARDITGSVYFGVATSPE